MKKSEFENPKNDFLGFKWDTPIMLGLPIVFLLKPPQ
jgi:hypothetical protein